jgi:hypothetical protein
MTCVHCCFRKPSRPFGMCSACYNNPAVRSLYTGTVDRTGRGYGLLNVNAAPLPEPTEHPPGTPDKLRVLEERARNGQALWHPNDARSG